ncbi:MAG: ABC transporter ATP-binding protein [Firmicutes bacterium]|nr:ABC transporter ATP-binding protein [Bacillota bacterium]
MLSSPVVETINMNVILGKHRVLEDINLVIESGEMVGIIGPNGAGKTTLMRVLLGLLKPTSGQVKLFGASPDRMGKKRDRVGYMPQSPVFSRHFPLSCLDVVTMGSFTATSLGRLFTGQMREKALRCLEMVGLLPLKNKPFAELSGGQQQRVLLARALVKDPLLLLLDEPNAGLDLPTQNHFFALLKELQSRYGLTVVIVSHDLVMISRYAGRLICINRTMHLHGEPLDVLQSSDLGKAYRCELDFLCGKVGV